MFPRQGLFHKFSTLTPTISVYNLGDVAGNYGLGIKFYYTPSASTGRAQLSYLLISNLSGVTTVANPEIRGDLYYYDLTVASYIKFAESNWVEYSATRKGLLLDFKNSPTTLVTDPEPNTGPIPMWPLNMLGPQEYLVVLRTKTISATDYFLIPATSTVEGIMEDSTVHDNECNLEYNSFYIVDNAIGLTVIPGFIPMVELLTEDVIDSTFLSGLPYYKIEGHLTDVSRKTLPYMLMDYARISTEGFAVGSSGFVNSDPQKPLIIDPTDTDLIARRFPTYYGSTPVVQEDLAIINPISYPSMGSISLTCKLGAEDYNSVLGEVGIWAKLTYWDTASVGADSSTTIGVAVGDYFLAAIAHFPLVVKNNNNAINLNVILSF